MQKYAIIVIVEKKRETYSAKKYCTSGKARLQKAIWQKLFNTTAYFLNILMVWHTFCKKDYVKIVHKALFYTLSSQKI